MDIREQGFAEGDVVAGRYRIVEELGRGSYGVVFRAEQLGIGRSVALKTLLPQTPGDSEESQRFEREALVVSKFNHPNIVTLFDYGEHEGVLFMVMEYVEGRELMDVIDEEAPMAPERVRSIVYQMLDALQYAHDKGVVHRDLKPENIQLLSSPSMESDQQEMVKILDFGIAKFIHGDDEGSALDTLTQTGVAMGTPQYMSPENITGDPVTHHADIYAVGLLMYEMLSGEPAFEGKDPQEVMVSHLTDPAPVLGGEKGWRSFDRALEWALRKQPDERAPQARALAEVLEEDQPVAAGNSAMSDDGSGDTTLTRALVAVVIAAVVVLILLVAVVISGG